MLTALFTYPNYGTPDGHPDYTAHSGQTVEIVRQCTDDECEPGCQPMWLIKADDGWTGHANGSELERDKPLEASLGGERSVA